MITQSESESATTAANEFLEQRDTCLTLPTIQEQIDAQRELIHEVDEEIKRWNEHGEFLETKSRIRRETLGELLNLLDLQKARENAIAVGPQKPRWD